MDRAMTMALALYMALDRIMARAMAPTMAMARRGLNFFLAQPTIYFGQYFA